MYFIERDCKGVDICVFKMYRSMKIEYEHMKHMRHMKI